MVSLNDKLQESKLTNRSYYFFIGTIAEFIKVVPVMQELTKRGIPFKVISSGQNALTGNELLPEVGLHNVDVVLNERPIQKSPLGLAAWFFETLFKGLIRLRSELRAARGNSVLVVHGDTVSTVMGAFIGKWFGLKVAHVEAGLRSFNFLQPFPEEIDRYLTSYLADIHFCPYQEAVDNLRRRKGEKISTHFNTNIDSLAYAVTKNAPSPLLDSINGEKFFIFIMHRQENLLNKALVEQVLRAVMGQSQNMKCVFVMHDLTRSTLEMLGLLRSVETDPNIISVPRLPYFEFVRLLSKSEFIVTDGGGNQQETYYLGKPCLILRNVTEGREGLNQNVVISRNDVDVIHNFMSNYRRWQKPPVEPEVRPSHIIAETLVRG